MHVDGSMEPATVAALPALLDELSQADDEHPDVAVKHESEWTLSVYRSGKVVWENVEADDEPRHLDGLVREATLALMAALINGRLDVIEAQPWAPGY